MPFGPIKKTQGFDSSFFEKIDVDWSTFGGGPGISDGYDGYSPDMFISFSTEGLIFKIYGTGNNVIEYSFNGNTVHGELIQQPSAATYTEPRSCIIFNDRIQSLIWFRIQSGSSAAVVSVEAWARP